MARRVVGAGPASSAAAPERRIPHGHVPIVAGLMLSMFLVALDGTVVSTAMPSIVGDLGGFKLYAWVPAVYLLTSAVSTPIYGKLADLYGRRPVLFGGIGLFVVGSMTSGAAHSMVFLIVARAVQGLGAGAVQPITVTIIGDVFTLEQRARVQGAFSSVWAISAIVGPLLGGFVADRAGYRPSFAVAAGLFALYFGWLRASPLLEHTPAQLRAVLQGFGVASGPRFLALARDVLANFVWFGFGLRSEVFVGVDNLNACCGIILRALGRTRRVVFYVIDYTPRRFPNRIANAIYHWADRFAVRHADEVWNISQRIAEIRKRQALPDARNRVVGVGVDLEYVVEPRVRRLHDVVVVSHLTEDKGVQLAIAAMPEIRRRLADSRLLIIGTGPYESALRRLASETQLGEAVQFPGPMEREQLFAFLPQWRPDASICFC